jgi:steroid 5-alpha reductase family enzyme
MDIKRIIIYSILFVILVAIATQGFMYFDQTGLFYPMLAVMGFFTLIFIIAQIVKDNSIVDMVWGVGFVLGAWFTLLTTTNPTILSYIVTGFITVWGVRLSARLVARNLGKPEDFRYAQWRKEWGDKVVITAFFRVFMIQGIINFVVGSASYVVIRYNEFVTTGFSQFVVYLGLLIAIVGLVFEVVGDEQLRRHIQKGKKELLKTGLWSITRHPNYFGDILIWNGLYIAGLSLLFTNSIGVIYYLILVLSPLIMTTVFVKISTPLLEKNMAKYDGWEEYTKQTPMLFPWGKRSK